MCIVRRFAEFAATWSGHVIAWTDGRHRMELFSVEPSPGVSSAIVVIGVDLDDPSEPVAIAVVCGGRRVELRYDDAADGGTL